MIRRLVPLLVALGLGALALAAGLWALHRTFVAERAAAVAESGARREALGHYARATLAQHLGEALRAAGPRLQAARQDPLLPNQDLLLIEGDRQRLPRAADSAAPGAPAMALLRRLEDPSWDPPAEDTPWGERLRLRRALFDALERGDRDGVERAFRATLAALARNVLPVERDVPFILAILSRFDAVGAPDPRLLRLLLHEGVSGGAAGRVESVQRRLLLRPEAFSREDLGALAARARRLGAAADVPDLEFRARLAELPGMRMSAQPWWPGTQLAAPTLAPTGWYLEPTPTGLQGVRVRVAPLLQTLTAQMRGRGLLGPHDHVVARGDLVGQIATLSLDVESPDWLAAEAAAAAAFQQKTLLLWLCALLAAVIVALAVLGQHRKQRFLALKGDFVSTVSHELRTPLASIRLMAETLERRVREVPRARDYPARIVRAVDGLALLVENILSFNRLDKGRWTARTAPMIVGDVLERAREKVVPHAGKPVTWVVKGDVGLVIDADAELIELLVVNLARNAAQYCEREPVEITFTVGRSPTPRIEVQDNGPGIPPEAARRIFTPFFRAPTSGGTRGSGLGLAICVRVMALHGGRVRLQRSDATGTTFALDFPAARLA